MSSWLRKLLKYSRTLWVRSTLIGALGVAAAILASYAERITKMDLGFEISETAVDSLLTVIASSMLAVTTFTLSVMHAALAFASSSSSPRASRLLVEDRLTQNVLATFVGSFLFSVVALVVLRTGAYGQQGRAVLFAFTIGVLGLIVIKLLQWINHLTQFGRISHTCESVERETESAIRERQKAPYFGGRAFHEPGNSPSRDASAVKVTQGGYVLHFDMGRLTRCAELADADIYLMVTPGCYAYRDDVLAWISNIKAPDTRPEALLAEIGKCFTIGPDRDFIDDPGHGLLVLSDIALRALSPAINDPGTAIDILGRQATLLSYWAEDQGRQSDREIRHPRIFVPPLDTNDLFYNAFEAVGRDGAGMIEVQVKLRKVCQALTQIGDKNFRAAAREQAALALKRAKLTLELDEDMQRLTAIEV